jgi:ribonuclease-3
MINFRLLVLNESKDDKLKIKDHPKQGHAKEPVNPEPSIRELTAQLNFEPVNIELFIEAITHSSFANEHNLPSNERLEFLGDSVLSLIVCRFLYCHYPVSHEGELAKLKSVIVSAPILASLAKKLNLNHYIRLGHGELRTNGRDKQNILADLFEAFIGAFFLNFGFEKTNDFLLPLIQSILPDINNHSDLVDAKSHLQEITQAQGLKPEYRTVREEGPPHCKVFTVEVLLNGGVLGCGTGRTLKEAQNKAAGSAIHRLKAPSF